jgi:hypothetical protein
MAHEYPAIDLNQGDLPDLAAVADEVHRTNRPRVLKRADEELAVVMPVGQRPRRTHKGKPVTENDALFRSIGTGKSAIPGGVSGKKHEYLLQAKRSHG